MKVSIIKVLAITLLFSLVITGFKTTANSMNIVDFLTQERIVMSEGIELHKRTALTAFNGNLDDKRPQNIQALIRPADSGATKVVNWSKGTAGGWALATVAQIAQDYEAAHPGWIVLGGVNGDFYGINVPDLHYGETNNTNVGSGMVFKPEVTGGMSVIGLKEDGSYVYGKPTHSAIMTLSIYNELDDLIIEYPINKINATPSTNEIAIIFNDINDLTSISTTNSKVISFSNHMFRRTYDNDPNPSRVHRYLAVGNVTTMVEDELITDLPRPEFKLVSKHTALNEILQPGYKIIAQHKLTGNFAGVTDATGYSHQVLIGGVPQLKNSSEAYVLAPNPRTAIGFKADGTIVLLMVDGRASTQQRNGITMYELGELLRRWDCVDGFNLDGGGSSSLVVRNDAGGFTTINYPSDGFDRRVANALLIVTRAPGIEIEEVGDTYVKVTNKSPNVANRGVISNVRITIDGITKTMEGDELIFDGLVKKMDYVINYAYDIVEPNKTLHARGDKIAFNTGKTKPAIESFHFLSPNASSVSINYEIIDQDEAIISKKILYAGKEQILPNLTGTIVIDDFPKGEAVDYQLVIEYSYDTFDESTHFIQSSTLSMTKLKDVPSIVAFSLTNQLETSVNIDYNILDNDASILSKKIRVNNVDYPLTSLDDTFVFNQLQKGAVYHFQLIVEYSRSTSTPTPVIIQSTNLSITTIKIAPIINKFDITVNEAGNYIISYEITDADLAISSISLSYLDQTIPLTNLIGQVSPPNLLEGIEYDFELTVTYRLMNEGNILTITDSIELYIEPKGLPTAAILGIVGGGGLSIAGVSLFFLLKRKR